MKTEFIAELDKEIDPELDSLPEKVSRKGRFFANWKAKAHKKMAQKIVEFHERKLEKDRIRLYEKHETAVRHKKRRLKKQTVDIS